MFRKNNFLGFTLIELLVVIALIGLLSTLAIVALNNSRKKARNLKRNADIVQLIKAFDRAADDSGGVLPEATPSGACLSEGDCISAGATVSHDIIVDNFIAPYIKTLEDPRDNNRSSYGYIYGISPSTAPGDPAIVFIRWPIEVVPITAEICGPGIFIFSMSDYLQCQFEINRFY